MFGLFSRKPQENKAVQESVPVESKSKIVIDQVTDQSPIADDPINDVEIAVDIDPDVSVDIAIDMTPISTNDQETDSIIKVPEEDKGGWYDPEVLANIDGTLSDDVISKIEANTEGNEIIVEGEESVIDDGFETYMSLSEWNNEGGLIIPGKSPLDEIEKPEEHEFVSTLILTRENDRHYHIASLTENRPVYLVDFSEDYSGIGMIPDNAELRKLSPGVHGSLELTVLPHRIADQENRGEEVFLVIVSPDRIIDRLYKVFGAESPVFKMVVNRLKASIESALENNISVILAPDKHNKNLNNFISLLKE